MNIHHCNKPIDVDLMNSPFLCNMIVKNTNKYAKDNQIKKWKVRNIKTSFTALVFNMRLIRKSDMITGLPGRVLVLLVSKGCLVVIILGI